MRAAPAPFANHNSKNKNGGNKGKGKVVWEPLSDVQKELLVYLVRATYCYHYAALAAKDRTRLPPRLHCPFHSNTALPPPTEHMGKGLSLATRQAVASQGFGQVLQGTGDIVAVERNGGITVRLDFLVKVRVVLVDKQPGGEPHGSVRAQVLEAVNKAVSVMGAQLGEKKQKAEYVDLLYGTPWDVIGFCRKAVYSRMALAVDKVQSRDMETRNKLAVLLCRFTQTAKGLWDPETEKDMQRLLDRLQAMQPPLVMSKAALPISYSPPRATAEVTDLSTPSASPRSPMASPLQGLPMPHSPLVSPTLASLKQATSSTQAPEQQQQQQQQQQQFVHAPPSAAVAAPAARVPRDPRKERLAKMARLKSAGPRKVDFLLPSEEEKGHDEHTTYFKSHFTNDLVYEEARALGVPGVTPQTTECLHCHTDVWEHKCPKCSRCQNCARKIFCKGAERNKNYVPGDPDTLAPHLMEKRMDQAIWNVFKDPTKDFHPILGLIQNKVSVNFQRATGETALMAAAFRGDVEVLKLLLQLGADPNKITDARKSPLTALSFAAKHGHTECVEILTPVTGGVDDAAANGAAPPPPN